MKFTDYYNEHKDAVFSYFLYNLSQDTQTAEDLTSDTFLKGFKKFESYNSQFAFSTWIFTIAKNTLFDYYRSKKVSIEINETTERAYSEFVSYETNLSQEIDAKDQLKKFLNILDTIDPVQREVIILKYLEDATNAEIAKKTKKSEANVRQIASRWLKKAKKLFENTNQNNIS